MRKIYVSIGVVLCCLLMFVFVLPKQAEAEAGTSDPPYAKWGRVAMQETKSKYPDAFIIDYLHVGRKNKNGSATETFKLWLRKKDGHEFGVYTTIEFEIDSERIIQIQFEETDR